ncbi:MAG: rRNA small subunit methyltransferase B [Austwickia sp.]|nr:rRNA small subunit methyltransferase B [Austwickia sp.]MBK8435631.1 rRNA small subunit methyltransferase B [Austwickia sp.]MBK9100799.1 rRNA small subunit methyltransferase B [Austwickia sp.]
MNDPDDRPSRPRGTGRISRGGAPRRVDPSRRSVQRPSERARSVDPARKAAWETMRAIDDGAYANLELPKQLRRARLTGRDAAFVTELVYGATRMRGLYDPILATCTDRPLADIDPAVLAVLRLGAHQLLGMRVPAYGAVSQQVALTRELLGAGASGFVNAVLRRVSEHDLETWQRQVAPRGDGRAGELAVRTSHPAWIVRAFRGALLGHGAAQEDTVDRGLRELLEANNAAAKVMLVARPGLCEVAELEAAGGRATGLSPYGVELDGGDPGNLPAVRQGRAAAQDEGSQLVVLALLAAELRGDPPHQERWLDLCAGPGGKAGLLAALAGSRAVLFANEISDHRADLTRRAVAAAVDAGSEVMVGVGDGRTLGEEEPDTFDRVLVDAPCSGLGSLRRRPEARWRRQPHDVSGLGELQRALLRSAIQATRPGGVIGYATCTPHLPETRYVVADVLAERDDVEIEDAQPLFVDASGAQIPDLGEPPYVQLWPHVHGTDAMFFALLRRREAT